METTEEEEIVKEPIIDFSDLKALPPNMLTKIFTYYGYFEEVIDLLQHLNHDSRSYVKSSNIVLLRERLAHKRNFPYSDLPMTIALDEI